MIYSRKNKYESRCTVKKRPSEHKREQQEHQTAQEQVIDKKSNHRSRDSCNQKKPSGRRNYIIGRNQKKPNKRTESSKGIGKE